MRQGFINDNCNRLGAMNLSSENLEQNWTVFQNVVHSSAVTTLGHPSRKHQAWFEENEEEIKKRFEEKHRLHKAHQDDTSLVCMKTACFNNCKTFKNRLRHTQDSWLSKKVFCRQKGQNEVPWCNRTSGAIPLLSANGSTLLKR